MSRESHRALSARLPADVVARVRLRLAAEDSPSATPLRETLRREALASGLVLGAEDLITAERAVHSQLWGLGVLEPLVALPGVCDVLVNGPASVWVDCGDGPKRTDVVFDSEDDVRALAVRLAATAGRRLDDAMPWVDARLPHGVRLHAVLPPVSPAGTLISLRVLRRHDLDLETMVAEGSVPLAWAPVLQAIVRRRLAFLVSGGTGAGKTTLLSALLSRVDPVERLVLVEDVGELRPHHDHVVRLEARHSNVEGRGAVTLADLVRQALRMRPDRIVVGECRGAEVTDLLAALNTGHAGGAGTVHANATADVPARLEALAALAGMPGEALRTQAAAALDVIVHVERVAGRRRLTEIATVRGAPGGVMRLQTALTRESGEGEGAVGPGWSWLSRRLGLDPEPTSSLAGS